MELQEAERHLVSLLQTLAVCSGVMVQGPDCCTWAPYLQENAPP